MRKAIFVLLALLLPVVASGAWLMPVPSGMTVGQMIVATDGHTLGQQAFTGAHADAIAYIGPMDVVKTGAGTMTLTRINAGRVAYVKTAAANAIQLDADITEIMRTTASKGMKLDSIWYVYGIGEAEITTHTLGVHKVTFEDASAPSVADVLAATAVAKVAGTVTEPFVKSSAIAVPAYMNPVPSATTLDKWTIDIIADGAATSTYNFYGLYLIFTEYNI